MTPSSIFRMERYPTIRAADCAPRRQEHSAAFLRLKARSALTSNKSVAGLVERVGGQLGLLIPKSESDQGAVSGLGGL